MADTFRDTPRWHRPITCCTAHGAGYPIVTGLGRELSNLAWRHAERMSTRTYSKIGRDARITYTLRGEGITNTLRKKRDYLYAERISDALEAIGARMNDA